MYEGDDNLIPDFLFDNKKSINSNIKYSVVPESWKNQFVEDFKKLKNNFKNVQVFDDLKNN